MKRLSDLFSPNRRPDFTLPAMILAVGLLLAWAHSSGRSEGSGAFRSGLFPFNLDMFQRD